MMRLASLPVLAVVGLLCVARGIAAGQATSATTAARQNELVQKRCMVCHNAVQRKGGLSLEHFDAANPDRAVAHLMSIKVSADDAMMAAGNPVPDRETIDAFVEALTTAVGNKPPVSNGWTVDLSVDPMMSPSNGHMFVTARAIQELPLGSDGRARAVYQLTISCSGAARRADVQLSTYTKAGPTAPLVARTLSTAPTFRWPTAEDKLDVNVFPGERATFPLGALSPTVREVFSWCFADKRSNNH
jgi:hypothetical protein